MGRNRYKKNKYYSEVAKIIGRNYSRLQSLCHIGNYGLFGSRSYEDIFQDTVIYVIHDKEANKIATDEALITHFRRRFEMIKYQTIQDAKQLKEKPYADYIQAKQNAEEE